MNKNRSQSTVATAAYHFPNLAKRDSDGAFSYYVQRRISCHITRVCNSLGMHPNVATGIDFLFAVCAAIALYFDSFLAAALFIQLFGLWSCVDGELARLSGKSSVLGDYYDTMVDRVAEFLIVGSLFLWSQRGLDTEFTEGLLLAYLGAVFLITNSSEKFRSAFRKNYPKRQVERLFVWICAGSDMRLLYLTVGIVLVPTTGSVTPLIWIFFLLTVSLYSNFLFRLWKVRQLSRC